MESDEGLGSEAVRVVGGDTVAPMSGVNMLLGSSAGADSAPVCGQEGE
jgi:hypothetical protein